MTPTVQLYADDRPVRRSTPKSLAARGRTLAKQAMKAYGAGDYPEAARLARQCEALALRLEAHSTAALWRDRAESAEARIS